MSLVAKPPAEQRFLSTTDWEGYLHALEAFKHRRIKITCDRGNLELLSPSMVHEAIKMLLGQLLDRVFLDRRVRFLPAGSTTFRRRLLDRGLEPDQCSFLTTIPKPTIDLDPEDVPIPDLAIEIEVSRSALDRLGIFQALGVREVWRYSADHRLTVEVLGPEGYRVAEASSAVPGLAPGELPRFVQIGLESDSLEMLDAFQAWLDGAR